jgi:UDP-N-acetylmuramoyl-L-alanyl-D-glutamate--2,6-diaminopimelate ligase
MALQFNLLELLPAEARAELNLAQQQLAQALFVSKLVLDSRLIKKGDVFIALSGTVTHGMQFAQAAIQAGASAIVFERSLGVTALAHPILQLEIPNLRDHLGAMAAKLNHYPAKRLTMLGVTGTNGKTTSVQLLAQAMGVFGKPCAHIGTLGVGLGGELQAGERTTPDVLKLHETLAKLDSKGAVAVAMEVSSHALMQGRVDGIRFQVALFTNLTRDHLDYHGTMGEYFEAKARLFEASRSESAVINMDDSYGAELFKRYPEALSFGESEAAKLRITEIQLHDSGANFVLRYRNESQVARSAVDKFESQVARSAVDKFESQVARSAVDKFESQVAQSAVDNSQTQSFQSPLLGRFNVWNLTGVIAVLLKLGNTLAQIALITSQLKPIIGRMSPQGGGELPLVVVDYAHTPDALQQVLSSLREHTAGQLICVFGCGGDRDPGKRPLMAGKVDQLADQAIVTNDNPRSESPASIAAQICAGFEKLKPQTELDRARAIRTAIALAKKGDVVLVAGKGHESYQEINGQRLPFDDQSEVRLALQRRAA